MEDHHHLLLPLLTTTTTSTNVTAAAAVDITSTTDSIADVNHNDERDNIEVISSNSNIILRLFSVAFVGILSIWANHEAAKGFEITVENHAAINSAAGQRFQLMYVSNDKATRLVLSASNFVETILYPNSLSLRNKKQVHRVILRLAGRNMTHTVTVDSIKEHEFVLNLSPSNLDEAKFGYALFRSVQQGMARVWLYDDNAPKPLLNGMVEYISRLAGLGVAAKKSGGGGDWSESGKSCWKDDDPVAVADFLSYCEEKRRGFIQRLNLGVKGRWEDRKVDDALGMPAQHICRSYLEFSSLKSP